MQKLFKERIQIEFPGEIWKFEEMLIWKFDLTLSHLMWKREQSVQKRSNVTLNVTLQNFLKKLTHRLHIKFDF